jgi:hypothetical protein
MTKSASSFKALARLIRSASAFVIRHSSFVILLAAAPAFSQGAAATPPISADRAAKDGSVWGALVLANNEPSKAKATEPKAEAAKADAKSDATAAEVCPNLSKRLAKVFPYSHFEIIGQHNQVVFREYESWVVPSREVFLKLDSKGAAANGGLNLHVQFWQGQQVLVKTDTVLQPNSPLFIGGPKYGDGQLIFVLLLLKQAQGAKGT